MLKRCLSDDDWELKEMYKKYISVQGGAGDMDQLRAQILPWGWRWSD